jgi:hypothetical protein
VKIPHWLFRMINGCVVLLLRSPLHGLVSGSMLAIRYTGVKSGRRLTVPARYLRRGDECVLVTSRQGRWWPNFRHGLPAKVLLAGAWREAEVSAFSDVPELAADIVRELWARHPADAAYMNVKMREGVPDADDLAVALRDTVVIKVATT